MPRYAAFFMFMMLASVGLPGTSGFVGEMLVLVGAWNRADWVAILAATGLILGACYMLWLYRRVVFGRAEKPEIFELEALSGREFLIFIPLTIFVLWFGIYPSTLLDIMELAVTDVLGQIGPQQTALK